MDNYNRSTDYQAGNSAPADTNNDRATETEQTTKSAYTTKHFWKCYLKDLLDVLDKLNSKQYKVFVYIVRHAKPSDNNFIGTYSRIAKDTKCCRQTVTKTIKILQDCDFLQKIQNGVWIINPNILIKGNENKQNKLYEYYKAVKSAEKSEENGSKDDSCIQEPHKGANKENSIETCMKIQSDAEDWDIEIDESYLPRHK